MKNTTMAMNRYPGNRWLAERLTAAGAAATVPFVHGFIRGAQAHPGAKDAMEAVPAALAGARMEAMPPITRDELELACLHLWDATVRAFANMGPFPAAVEPVGRTLPDEGRFLAEAAALAEGFVQGFRHRRPPVGVRFTVAGSWLKDIDDEGIWCRMMAEYPDRLRTEFPEANHRRQALADALAWIEECMGWVAIYARMDVDRQGERGKANGERLKREAKG